MMMLLAGFRSHVDQLFIDVTKMKSNVYNAKTKSERS